MKMYLTTRKTPVLGGLLCFLLMAAFATPAQAQMDQEAAMHYSLYWENFKNGDCDAAMPDLKWIIENAPMFPNRGSNHDRNFERLRECYEKYAEAATEPDMKRAYVDSAVATFDQAMSTIQDAGVEDFDPVKYTFEKGRFMQKHGEVLADRAPEVCGIYEDTFNSNPEMMSAYYIEFVIRCYVSDDNKEGAVAYMDRVETAYPDNAEMEGVLDQWRNALFRNPEERYEFVKSQLDKEPDNVELMRELFEIAQDLEYRDDVMMLGDRLMQVDPSPATFTLMGEMYQDDGDIEGALGLYQRAIDMGAASKEIYYNMGLAEKEMGRLSRARGNFRQALELDPNFGRALMGIASVYQQAVADCGSFEREDRTVYWLVADYYSRAANADPAIASSAQQQAASMRRYFPSAEDKFFKKWTDGSSFTVNAANSGSCYGWINETTRVR